MENIEKIIEYINTQTIMECKEIIQGAQDESERIRASYYRDEQDEYWKAINAGSKESELRLRSLNALASEEANKKVEALRREMLHEALMLAATKLSELPSDEFKKILKKAGVSSDLSCEEFVLGYEERLSASVMSALFD